MDLYAKQAAICTMCKGSASPPLSMHAAYSW